MRTLLAASTLAMFTAVLLPACASADANGAGAGTDVDPGNTASTAEALARRGSGVAAPTGNQGIVDPPPPPHHPTLGVVATGGLLAPVCEAPARRFDLRRRTRSCEDLPGAVTVNGVTTVPGTGGHYVVGRLLEGTSAPPVIQAKACIYTWQPDGCAAPDVAKLLLEPGEAPTERPATCISDPASCGASVVPTAPFRVPHIIPNGPGRCEVCGFATNRSLWVVLPDGWRGFQYRLSSASAPSYVYLDPPADPAQAPADPTVIEVPLDESVVDQDVSLGAAYQ